MAELFDPGALGSMLSLATEGLTGKFDCVLLWIGDVSQESHVWAPMLARRFPVFRVGFASNHFVDSTTSGDETTLLVPADSHDTFGPKQKAWLTTALRQRGFRRPLIIVVGKSSVPIERIFRESFKVRVLLPTEFAQDQPRRISGWELFVSPASQAHNVRRLLHITEPVVGLKCLDAEGIWTDNDEDQFFQLIAKRAEELSKRKRNILVLYDDHVTHITTVREYLQSFQKYSEHTVHYAIATNGARCFVDLNYFDAVFIHYSVRFSYKHHLSPDFAEQLRGYLGPKIQFIQDEYDQVDIAKEWMRYVGVDVVYTCVPQQYIEIVYPKAEFPDVRFIQTLTGFVPVDYESVMFDTSMAHRKTLIGYRGRALPFWYGRLGREKIEIATRMREICEARGLRVDIEWTDEHRLYGDAWYDFMMSCRAVLGTESGANVFDFDGTLRSAVEKILAEDSDATFEAVHARVLAPHEGLVKMNQVSPRIFEAIAFGAGLILFEGEYSGVVKPGEHYIPLKKDFSNVDEVLTLVHDDEFMRQMTERAYRDVIGSGKYSYRKFVADVMAVLDEFPCARLPGAVASTVTANLEFGSPKAFGVMVGVSELQWVGNYPHAVSGRFLPSTGIADHSFSDGIPSIPDYFHKPPQYIEVPIYPNANSFLTTIRTKALLRTLVARAYMTIPYYPRKALKVAVSPIRQVIRWLWK